MYPDFHKDLVILGAGLVAIASLIILSVLTVAR
jgi:hypothetical protein